MKFKERRYLRKKSLLVHEYIVGGLVLAAFGLMFHRYNNKINPKDKKDEDTKCKPRLK